MLARYARALPKARIVTVRQGLADSLRVQWHRHIPNNDQTEPFNGSERSRP